MATADTSTPAGVRVDTSPLWGNIYQGTAEALVAAGLVRLDQLPGQPGRGKTVAAYLPDGTMLPIRHNRSASSEPGLMSIRRSSTRQYQLSICVDEAEQTRRLARLRAEQEEERKRYQEAQERQKELAEAAKAGMTPEEWALRHIPTDEGQYRTLVREHFKNATNFFEHGMDYLGYGLTFGPATKARLRMLFSAADKVLAEGEVLLDQEVREQSQAEALQRMGITPEQEQTRPALRLVSQG